ncbi:MAG: cyclic nucleotide-binding domain-containing protein [Chloroflexi bacterium]|nr:cyclic nucleotide-binding domain-containing protein [Chloroflexota bacterium]
MENAQAVLDRVEQRTAYLLAQTRRALLHLLVRESRDFDFYSALEQTNDPAFRPTIEDLERFVEAWGHVVPTDIQTRVDLIHLLSQRYDLKRDEIPDIRKQLGMDTQAIAGAYQEKFGEPIDTIYAAIAAPDPRPYWAADVQSVPQETMVALEREVDYIQVQWGDILFEQGDPGDNLYVLVSGRMRAVRTEEDGTERILEEMAQGEIIGEVALLTGQPRGATVYAVRDCELIRLTRTGLERLMRSHPTAIYRITREMVSRIQATDQPLQREGRIASIAVVPVSPGVDTRRFAEHLSESLAHHGPVLHLTIERFTQLSMEAAASFVMTSRQQLWLEEQEAMHRFIVYEADAEPTAWTRRCLSQADRILLVADERDTPDLSEVEEMLRKPDLARIATGQELILLHNDRSTRPSGTAEWLDRRQIVRHHHMVIDHLPDFDRLARFMAGVPVGLALGGGGARGLAHIGVLRAVEEAGIPVDYIGGVSFGAIIAGAVAAGHDSRSIEKTLRDVSTRIRSYVDVTFPVLSVIAARRINRLLKTNLGDDTQIEDLWTPCFAVSSNLNRGQPVVHTRGSLWRAVRASIAIPVLLPPLLDQGNLLTDGGAFTNIPADVMLQQLGNGRVIGSSVTPAEEITEEYRFGEAVGAFDILMSRINPNREPIKTPNAASVLVWAMGLGNTYLRPQQEAAADLMLNLPVEDYEIFAFDQFDELVRAGYETARRQVSAWYHR